MRSRFRQALSRRYLQFRRPSPARALPADHRAHRRHPAAGRSVTVNPSPGAWQIPRYLEARRGRLFLDGVDLVDLASAHGTPLYVYSAARITETARRIRDAFQRRHPKAFICYASKALSAIKALRLIEAEGLGIEVNSGGELFRAKLAGFAQH